METTYDIIAQAYQQYGARLLGYIRRRINTREEAEDILQDTFVRLLDYDVVCEDTVKSLAFTIANNIIIDRLRRHYKRQEVQAVAFELATQKSVTRPDQELAAKDLARMEHTLVARMTPATARVYQMTRFQELKIEEIATELSLSRRTVECHQLKSRKFVRQQLRMVL